VYGTYVGVVAEPSVPYDPVIGQQVVIATVSPVLMLYLISRFGGELIALFRR
jgi:hypothetical protein